MKPGWRLDAYGIDKITPSSNNDLNTVQYAIPYRLMKDISFPSAVGKL
jgi:hypothetical protein